MSKIWDFIANWIATIRRKREPNKWLVSKEHLKTAIGEHAGEGGLSLPPDWADIVNQYAYAAEVFGNKVCDNCGYYVWKHNTTCPYCRTKFSETVKPDLTDMPK